LIIGFLGILFIAGVSLVLLDEELARQVMTGVEQSQGIEIQKSTFIEGGLVYAEIFTIIISFLVGMNLISNDIRSNAIAQYLIKPISRQQYLIGKFFGALSVSLIIFIIYELLLLLTLLIDGGDVQFPLFKVLFITLFKMALLYSMILLFVQKLPGFVASLLATSIYLTGYFAGDFYIFSISADGVLKLSSLAIYYLLPHMIEVSPGSIMSDPENVISFLKWALVYGGLYSGIWLYGGLTLFERRDI